MACKGRGHGAGCECGFGMGREVATFAPPHQLAIVKTVTASDGTRVALRSDCLSDDDLVLIHLGAGAVEVAARAALLNFDIYRGLESQDGLLCVSVFGLTHGVTRDDILAVMKHGKYGEARYGDIKHLVRLLPTSITDDDTTPEMAAIQTAHFDLVIDLPDPSIVAGREIEALDESQREALRAHVVDVLTQVLPKFAPRRPREEGRR